MIHEISHGRKFPDMLLNKTNYYQKLAIRKGEKKKKNDNNNNSNNKTPIY